MNFWFERVVYTRDEWDEWLIETSEEVDFRIGWIFWVARCAVFLSRGILWVFMMLSCAASSWLMRQMEFDADRYETRIRKRIRRSKTGWLDTHPADRERIERAALEKAPGVFSSNLPAEAVFTNFDRLCLSMFLAGQS